MKILFCGDIVGRAGRDVVIQLLPDLRERLELDFIIVNGENSANGFGITEAICSDLYAAGADVITTGNHVWDQRDIIGQIDADNKLLRPVNFPIGTPGRGANVYDTINGRRVLVINVMCRLFMDPLDDPFVALERLLSENTLGGSVDAIIIDVHGEASSEKMAIGHAFDGRASLVVGTHTHVPTADLQILDGGTAYQTDAGMCGDYDSVIGMRKAPAIERFRRKIPGERLSPASGPADLCGVFIETDDKTGLASYVAPLRIGNRLFSTWPDRYEDR
ncbi:MAG: TIGR00282 family metallophosphoesterase [Alphaproteobacteria bacterium]|tara:strand:+ start:16650 stop:17477 length:828 start_codon:yes stop_codon:yes gene_type:complete